MLCWMCLSVQQWCDAVRVDLIKKPQLTDIMLVWFAESKKCFYFFFFFSLSRPPVEQQRCEARGQTDRQTLDPATEHRVMLQSSLMRVSPPHSINVEHTRVVSEWSNSLIFPSSRVIDFFFPTNFVAWREYNPQPTPNPYKHFYESVAVGEPEFWDESWQRSFSARLHF